MRLLVPFWSRLPSPSEQSVPNHETASSNNGLTTTTLSISKRKSTSFFYFNLLGNQKEENALLEQMLNWIKMEAKQFSLPMIS